MERCKTCGQPIRDRSLAQLKWYRAVLHAMHYNAPESITNEYKTPDAFHMYLKAAFCITERPDLWEDALCEINGKIHKVRVPFSTAMYRLPAKTMTEYCTYIEKWCLEYCCVGTDELVRNTPPDITHPEVKKNA